MTPVHNVGYPFWTPHGQVASYSVQNLPASASGSRGLFSLFYSAMTMLAKKKRPIESRGKTPESRCAKIQRICKSTTFVMAIIIRGEVEATRHADRLCARPESRLCRGAVWCRQWDRSRGDNRHSDDASGPLSPTRWKMVRATTVLAWVQAGEHRRPFSCEMGTRAPRRRRIDWSYWGTSSSRRPCCCYQAVANDESRWRAKTMPAPAVAAV